MRKYTTLLIYFLLSISTLQAATIFVSNLNDSGEGSLRQALTNAVNGDVISINIAGSITLSSELPIITQTITINGNNGGTIISGNNACRIFTIQITTGTIALNNLMVVNGLSSNGAAAGLYAITGNNAKVVLVNCSFTGCVTNGTEAYGGAIATSADMDITNCTFSLNSASASGGAIATLSACTLNILNCTLFKNNTANTSGTGGIDLTENAIANIQNTILAGNTANGMTTAQNALSNGGTITSLGNNLSDTSPFANTSDLVTKNLITDIKLSDIALMNGSYVCTLNDGSVAINAANANAPATDQLGYSRIGAPDIGALEVQIQAPTDISLSASSINENVAGNSTIGTLSSTDADAGKTFTYTLAAGTGDTDNTSFSLSGNSLKINASPDFETKSSYTIRVRTTDQGGLWYEKAFTVTINDLNESPTDIALSANSINENVATNSTVGTLSSTDLDAGNSFTYTLVAGTGDTDNTSFNLSGNSLRINASPDFETKSSYTVRVRTTDQGDLWYEKAFSITINDLNESPTDIALSASSIDENVASNTTVGTLSSTDPDAGNSFTYTLAAGTGDTDNTSFNLSGSSLKINASPDFETKSSYTVLVRTTDQGGLWYEKAFSITINDLNEYPTVTTQAVSSIFSTAATGNGNLTDLGYPNPTAYGICWNTTGAPTTSDSNVDNGATSATGAFTASITGLTAGTTYYVRAFATNSAGTSYGETVNFTTLKASSVTTQAVSSISTSSAVGNGNITDLGYPNPTAYGFCWSTTPNPTTANSKIDKGTTTTTGTFTATLTGLTPYTTYYVRAYSTNAAGTSYGEEVSFATKGTAPSVYLYEINDIEATSAIGKCSISDFGIPNPTAYGICWSTQTNPTMFNGKIHNMGIPATTGVFYASLSGLEPNTVYYARTYAANTEQISYSNEISFKTSKLNPVISWNNPSDIFYGTALSDSQLNATANVEGTFVYNPSIGTILDPGNAQNLSVTFTPNDLTKNDIVSKTVQINVVKSIPVIIWENPKDIVHGTALSEIQLNATADIDGTFVYDPVIGTILNTGDGQTLTVTFTPTDAEHYEVTTRDSVKINVSIGTGTDIKAQTIVNIFISKSGN